MSTVAQVIVAGRRRIHAREPAMVRQLLDAYDLAWKAIARELDDTLARIAAAEAAGSPVSASWLRQQAWWRQFQSSIEREMQVFGVRGGFTLTATQRGAVHVAQATGTGVRAVLGGGFAPQVNAGAMERWVSMLRPGSPLRPVLDRYGERMARSIETRITEGLGSGLGSQNIIRAIRADIGTEAVTGRVHTLVRTESMRAYRGGLADQMEPLRAQGAIIGYRWLCAKSDRTCAACLGRDGRVFARYPTGWHPGCRCVAEPVVHPDLLPPRERESGSAWFARQDAETQRRILRTRDRFDAYQDGTPLDAFVGVRRSRAWGPSIYVRPARNVTRRSVRKAPKVSGANPVMRPARSTSPGAPLGTPVSTAVRITPGGRAQHAQDALAAIDRVHGDGQLPSLPVRWSDARSYRGQYAYAGREARFVNISTVHSEKPRMTVAHELGHFLDHQGLGSPGQFASEQLVGTPEFDRLAKWRDAVRTSRRGRALMDARQTGHMEFNGLGGKGEVVMHRPGSAYVRYVNEDAELWARSYEQYISSRSGDVAMRQELMTIRTAPGQARLYWDDDDFGQIAEAMDALFRELGWTS